MKTITPRLETLPPSQRALWPQLTSVGHGFVLYGGTAIALQLGGRQSVDFDFFTPNDVEPEILRKHNPFLKGAQLIQRAAATATFSVNNPDPVKISFFGTLTFGRVDAPSESADNGVLIASLLDLAAQKVRVIQQRAEKKDYLDIFALLQNGITLEAALGAACALDPDFNPIVSLKAVTFFKDGDLPSLPPHTQQALANAAAKIKAIEPILKISSSLLKAKHSVLNN